MVVFAEDDEQIAKLRERRVDMPDVLRVVIFDGDPDGDWVITLDELRAAGRASYLASDPGAVDDRIDAHPARPARDDHLHLGHHRPSQGRAADATTPGPTRRAAVDVDRTSCSEDDLQYLWLPLAHVFGKVLLTLPLQIGFPTAVDGRVDKIVDNLAVVKPTFMGAAPRIFEKAYGRITTMMAEEGGLKEKLFRWSVGVGREVSAHARTQGEEPTGLLAKKLRPRRQARRCTRCASRFGGRIRFFISGSAALNHDIAHWFDSIGLTILEGYGLTETSAASFVNRPSTPTSIGTVGWALPGTEVQDRRGRRGAAARARHHGGLPQQARGRRPRPWTPRAGCTPVTSASSTTAASSDHRPQEGLLQDLAAASTSRPSMIESTFKGLCPYVSQFMVYGADHNFVTALVTLDPEADRRTGPPARRLAGKSYAEIVTSTQARDMVQVYVDSLNVNLNRWEQIKKFTILDHDLTIEDGELTPSLKLRRKVVSEKYQDDARRPLHGLSRPRLAARPPDRCRRWCGFGPGRRGPQGGSATRGTKRYHPCSSTAGPSGAGVVALDAQHPAGHRHDEDAVRRQLGDQLLAAARAPAPTPGPGRTGASAGAPSTPATAARTWAHGIRAASTLAAPSEHEVGHPLDARAPRPVGPTSSASRAVVQPDPAPTSSTRWPGRTSSSSSIGAHRASAGCWSGRGRCRAARRTTRAGARARGRNRSRGWAAIAARTRPAASTPTPAGPRARSRRRGGRSGRRTASGPAWPWGCGRAPRWRASRAPRRPSGRPRSRPRGGRRRGPRPA